MKPTIAELRRLVGRPDVYALQSPDGTWRPVREPLTTTVLAGHLAAFHTVGTYINEGDQSHLLVFDVDSGIEEESLAIRDALLSLGVHHMFIGIEYSGRKGWHVWVTLTGNVAAKDLRRFGRAALAIADVKCELNPKQDEVRDLGNLVKLPGGMHQVTGNPNNFLGRAPRQLPVAKFQDLLGRLAPEVHARRDVADSRFPCMESIQTEGCADHRNIQLFHLATLLRRGGVSSDNVEAIIRRTNDMADPLEERELSALIDSSAHSGPICSQLPDDRHCKDLCILERTSGLYARPGAVRHAGEGERVVLVVSKHKDSIVEFSHEDLAAAKGRLRE